MCKEISPLPTIQAKILHPQKGWGKNLQVKDNGKQLLVERFEVFYILPLDLDSCLQANWIVLPIPFLWKGFTMLAVSHLFP